MLHALPKGFQFLTLESFEPCVGEEFEVDAEPIAVRLRLDHLTKFSRGPGFMTRAPFTLLWSTAPEVQMVLGTYWLRNGRWGPHQVYIEPTLASGSRRSYQSVFF